MHNNLILELLKKESTIFEHANELKLYKNISSDIIFTIGQFKEPFIINGQHSIPSVNAEILPLEYLITDNDKNNIEKIEFDLPFKLNGENTVNVIVHLKDGRVFNLKENRSSLIRKISTTMKKVPKITEGQIYKHVIVDSFKALDVYATQQDASPRQNISIESICELERIALNNETFSRNTLFLLSHLPDADIKTDETPEQWLSRLKLMVNEIPVHPTNTITQMKLLTNSTLPDGYSRKVKVTFTSNGVVSSTIFTSGSVAISSIRKFLSPNNKDSSNYDNSLNAVITTKSTDEKIGYLLKESDPLGIVKSATMISKNNSSRTADTLMEVQLDNAFTNTNNHVLTVTLISFLRVMRELYIYYYSLKHGHTVKKPYSNILTKELIDLDDVIGELIDRDANK